MVTYPHAGSTTRPPGGQRARQHAHTRVCLHADSTTRPPDGRQAHTSACHHADRTTRPPGGPGQRVQVNGPRWRRVSLALLDVLRRSGPATVVRSCSEMPLFRPGNAPWSAMGSVPIKSVNLNSLPWSAGLAPFQDLVNVVSHPAGAL